MSLQGPMFVNYYKAPGSVLWTPYDISKSIYRPIQKNHKKGINDDNDVKDETKVVKVLNKHEQFMKTKIFDETPAEEFDYTAGLYPKTAEGKVSDVNVAVTFCASS